MSTSFVIGVASYPSPTRLRKGGFAGFVESRGACTVHRSRPVIWNDVSIRKIETACYSGSMILIFNPDLGCRPGGRFRSQRRASMPGAHRSLYSSFCQNRRFRRSDASREAPSNPANFQSDCIIHNIREYFISLVRLDSYLRRSRRLKSTGGRRSTFVTPHPSALPGPE